MGDAMDNEQLMHMFNVNVFSMMHLVREAMPHLLKSPSPRITGISSGASLYPFAGLGAYSMYVNPQSSTKARPPFSAAFPYKALGT